VRQFSPTKVASLNCLVWFKHEVKLLMGLLTSLSERCADLPDLRTGKNRQYTMRDIGLAAFSLFFMQDPSFLAHQKRLQKGRRVSNCQTLFGMKKIPTPNHIRKHLDGISPSHFDDVFAQTVKTFAAEDNLAPFRRLGEHTLIALDGTEYFSSYKVHCGNCSHRNLKNKKTQYFHTFLSATIVSPGNRHVLPLPPEFMVPQDGYDKQDSEPMAAKRWLEKHGSQYADLKPIYLGDDLYSKHPMCTAIHAAGGNFILTCKPDSHKTLFEYLQGADLHEYTMTIREGKKTVFHRYTWLCHIPIRDGDGAVKVNFMQLEILNEKDEVTYRTSFVTDLPVDRENIVEMVSCGRTRWKIENESFNVLKNNGYNLEHNFGHGKETLAAVLVVLNLLAFAFHSVCDFLEQAWQLARRVLNTRRAFFEQFRVATFYFIGASGIRVGR
jgi:hypothetical protein